MNIKSVTIQMIGFFYTDKQRSHCFIKSKIQSPNDDQNNQDMQSQKEDKL